MKREQKDRKVKVIHYNLPQLRMAVVRAQIMVMLAGRRTGKTTGAFAPHTSWGAFQLPRSLGAIVTPTYKKFLTEFIPSYIDGLERLGYIQERDYFIGRRGPKVWDVPYHHPQKFDNAIHWRSGSADVFVSQDIPGAGAGLTLDRIAADEAKYLDGERFQYETLLAMSGHPQYFKDKPEHKSLFLTSDRPYHAKGKWFYKYRSMVDPATIKMIIQLEIEGMELRQRIAAGNISQSTLYSYTSRLNRINKFADLLRIGAVYWLEASTIDNIHAVGLDYIREMAEGLDVGKFSTSVLNLDVNFVPGGFYPDLDDERHTYVPSTAAYTVSLGLERDALDSLRQIDSRHDAEILPNLPLEIAMDYGNTFNCMAVGQMFGKNFRIDRGFHVRHPQKVGDVMDMFIEHYRPHRCRDVVYYYDHTAKGHDGKDEYSYADIVIKALRNAGWSVTPVYIGKQPTYEFRYEAWADFLGVNGNPPFSVTWNRDNCEDMLISLHMASAKQDFKGFRKDKGPEKDAAQDQAHATHYSDACDTLVIGRTLTMRSKINLPIVSGFVG